MREKSEPRPGPVAGNARDEIRPVRDFGVELDLDPVLLEVLTQKLRRQGLVPGRVDRVQADQLPEEVGRLLTQRDGGQLGPLPVMRPRFRGSMSKPGKDAGSLNASQHWGD